MVATFLEAAYAAAPDDPEGVDISQPRLGELASIAALAVRLRLGGVEAPARPRLWGDAVRLAALVGLLGLASLSLAIVLVTVWVSLRLLGTDLPPEAVGPGPENDIGVDEVEPVVQIVLGDQPGRPVAQPHLPDGLGVGLGRQAHATRDHHAVERQYVSSRRAHDVLQTLMMP